MTIWNEHSLHKHMSVVSSTNDNLGHVEEIYEDSFLIRKGIIFSKDRYIPYSAIERVEDNTVHLDLTTDEAREKEWERRPDYENHPGDPTQLLYDRGHGIHDPFDETNPDKI